MTYGFIQLPRSLFIDPLWLGLTSREQHVYMTFLNHMCFKIQQVDDHGVLITLKPGQFMTTKRAFADICNLTICREMEKCEKSFIERCWGKFRRYNFLSQEVSHKKTILTCTRIDIMELIEPGFEPKVSQDRAKVEPQTKNDKKDDKEEKSKNDSFSDCSYVHNSTPSKDETVAESYEHPNESIEESSSSISEIKIVSDRSSSFDIDTFVFPDGTLPSPAMVGIYKRGNMPYREKFLSNLGYCFEKWDAGKKPNKSYEIMLQDAITNDYMKKELNKMRNRTWASLQVRDLANRGIVIKVVQSVVQLWSNGVNIDSISFDTEEDTFHWRFNSMINHQAEKFGV